MTFGKSSIYVYIHIYNTELEKNQAGLCKGHSDLAESMTYIVSVARTLLPLFQS